MLKIYNTLTKKKEIFEPMNAPEVKMYACGITTNGKAHIGHTIQAVIFDIIRKYLEKSGYNVTYARNYTDVDDKIIEKANECGMDAMVLSKQNMDAIDKALDEMGVTNATKSLLASENIHNIIQFVEKLSNRNLDDAINGVRIDTMDNKRNPLDFALWKSAKPNEPYWESPWGKGRPGWHIECSAMNYYHLGEQIDIHGGGRDLVFPHHENEIAQTEAMTGKTFAKYWIHNGLVKINGQKMSKSMGNGILLEDLLKKYDEEVIRLVLLQGSYRNDLNIMDGMFDKAEEHLYDFYVTLSKVDDKFSGVTDKNSNIDKEFNEAMDDDFNTGIAIANLYGYFKTINSKLANNDASAMADKNAIVETYK